MTAREMLPRRRRVAAGVAPGGDEPGGHGGVQAESTGIWRWFKRDPEGRWLLLWRVAIDAAGEEEDNESGDGTGRRDAHKKEVNKQEEGKAKLWEVFAT